LDHCNVNKPVWKQAAEVTKKKRGAGGYSIRLPKTVFGASRDACPFHIGFGSNPAQAERLQAEIERGF
jgi:hypothetical protein